MDSWLNTLFDPDDFICPAIRLTDNGSIPISAFTRSSDCKWICINSLSPYSTRAIRNISKFRTFLIEIDDLPLKEQDKYVNSKLMPYSTKIHSGGNSFHYC